MSWGRIFSDLAIRKKCSIGAFLKEDIWPEHTASFVRASAIMVTSLAENIEFKPKRLVFLVPLPPRNISLVVTAGLLISKLAQSQPGHEKGNPWGANPIIPDMKDILLISHVVGKTINELNKLSIGDISLGQIWGIQSFSKYTAPKSEGKPRVYVANSGWIIGELPSGKIHVTIIDATHPRTMSNIEQILETCKTIPIQIVIAPPLLQNDLSLLIGDTNSTTWLWDPLAQTRLTEITESENEDDCQEVYDRILYICEHPAIDEILHKIHSYLGQYYREQQDPFKPLFEAWSIYHRFRQLTIPLAMFEDSNQETWGAITLHKRIERLKSVVPEEVALQGLWSSIFHELENAYNIFHSMSEPPKFWSITKWIESVFKEYPDESIRVITPSKREATILKMLLPRFFYSDEISWIEKQQRGILQILSYKEEMRALHDDCCNKKLLCGFRTSKQRYLDLYPNCKPNVIAYPYEAEIEKLYQNILYSSIEPLQKEDKRLSALRNIGLQASSPNNTGSGKICPRPQLEIRGRYKPVILQTETIKPEKDFLDLDKLATSELPFSWEEGPMEMPSSDGVTVDNTTIALKLTKGRMLNLSPRQSVYIYHSGVGENGEVMRSEARNVCVGDKVVLFVDDVYDSLFDRLLDALKSRVSHNELLCLDFWTVAKEALLKKYSWNRMKLYKKLHSKGLDLSYGTIIGYFQGDSLNEGIIGPRDCKDFRILAEESNCFPSPDSIKLTFKAIEKERARRRKAGKALHSLLRAIVAGDGYEKVMARANKDLGDEFADALTAVDICEVLDVDTSGLDR